MKEAASRTKQEKTTQTILVVNVDKKRGTLGGLTSLLYTPIKAYWTAQYWDGILGIGYGCGYRQRINLAFDIVLWVDSEL